MASLLDRFRAWVGVNNDRTEHDAVRRDLTEQRLRIARIDAELAVRDRRRLVIANHPDRRAEDR